MQVVGEGSRRLSTNYHLIFRFLKLLIFLSVIAGILTMLSVCQLSIMDLVICCLAFLPTGWGLLSVSINEQPLLVFLSKSFLRFIVIVIPGCKLFSGSTDFKTQD